jgi:hypothetical protein
MMWQLWMALFILNHTTTLLFFFIFLINVTTSSSPTYSTDNNAVGVSCYECGVTNRGDGFSQVEISCQSNTLSKYRLHHNCTACLKIFTEMHFEHGKARWGEDVLILTTESRTCIKAYKPLLPLDRCATYYGSSSLTRRCYCSTHLCNKGSSQWKYRSQIISQSFVNVIVMFIASILMS